MDYTYIDRNVERIREKIELAAKASGRKAEDIVLLSAIKSAGADEVNYIHKSLGIHSVGENRVQQLLERYDKLDRDGLDLHFIGSLQTNKVKYIIDKVSLIHSLDSLHLAKEIQKQAEKTNTVAKVLVEINSGNEENKGGISPSDAEKLCIELQRYERIKLCGFMTMAPKCEKKEDYYPYFDSTRTVAERIWKNALGYPGSPMLSMGMSESFEAAIECGSTMVRIGRSMFAKDS